MIRPIRISEQSAHLSGSHKKRFFPNLKRTCKERFKFFMQNDDSYMLRFPWAITQSFRGMIEILTQRLKENIKLKGFKCDFWSILFPEDSLINDVETKYLNSRNLLTVASWSRVNILIIDFGTSMSLLTDKSNIIFCKRHFNAKFYI